MNNSKNIPKSKRKSKVKSIKKNEIKSILLKKNTKNEKTPKIIELRKI